MKNQIYEHCKEQRENEGVSIWHFPKSRLRPQYVTSNINSIPSFDSNATYIVLHHVKYKKSLPLNTSIAPYHSLKAFFWVGSRCSEYERNFQETFALVSEAADKMKKRISLRFHIEFEYAETLQFFELFKRSGLRQDLGIERCTELSAIQYQDFLRTPLQAQINPRGGNSQQFAKLIGFPKILIFELMETSSEYPKYYVRIYERRQLNSKIKSKNVYMFIQGKYETQQSSGQDDEESKEDLLFGKKTATTSAEIKEKITQIDVFLGSKANYVLSQFVKRYVQSFRFKDGSNPKVNLEKQKGESISSSELWSRMEDAMIHSAQEVDKQWPCELVDLEKDNYPYPYLIEDEKQGDQVWKQKTDEEIEDTSEDAKNVRFAIKEEYNVKITKRHVDFDTNMVQVFRVSLSQNEQNVERFLQFNKANINQMEFKERFLVTFQQLHGGAADSAMLSCNQSYLIFTPYSLVLWHGKDVELSKRKGSLFVLKTFFVAHLNESINFQPGYLYADGDQSLIFPHPFRVELQNYESRRFKQLFLSSFRQTLVAPLKRNFGGYATSTQHQHQQCAISTWNQDDRLDALMMGLKRCDDSNATKVIQSPEDSQQEEEKSSSSSQSSGDEKDKIKEADHEEDSEEEDPFEKRQQTFQQVETIRQTQKMVNKGTIIASTQQQKPVSKGIVNQRPRLSSVSGDAMFMSTLSSGLSKMGQSLQASQSRKTVMDMSRIKEEMKKMAISATNEDLQKKYLKLVSCPFRPNAVFSNVVSSNLLGDDLAFDSIVIYQIQGGKFEQIITPDLVGIFDASKSYYIVFTQTNTDKSIAQTSALAKEKHAVYLWLGNDQTSLNLNKGIVKMQETEFRGIPIDTNDISIQSSNSTPKKLVNVGPKSRRSVMHSTLELKQKPSDLILTPVINLKFAQKDQLDQLRISNMRSLLDEQRRIVNLRTICTMDHEPMHLLQGLQGSMVIVTNDYLSYSQQKILMFQLIGVPCLNQKAREVAPCYESFSSTGLYILFASHERVYFWIGHEFYKRYLWDAKAMADKKLISDGLYMRLLTIYRRDVLYEDELDNIHTIYEQSLQDAEIVAEGDEPKSFMKVIKGKNANNNEDSQSSESEGEEDDDDEDVPLVKYESPFIKKTIVPQEPRLYCLIYNSQVVEYQEAGIGLNDSLVVNESPMIVTPQTPRLNQDRETQGSVCLAENESVVMKEIHRFRQRSLDDKGVFLLDFASEAYLWVGKKIQDKDRLQMYTLAMQHLSMLHQQSKELAERIAISIVESGYEPEVFKSAFVVGGWQNFEHTLLPSQSSGKNDEDSDEGETSKKQAQSASRPPIELVPDNVWIN